MPTTTISPITATIPPFTVTPTINTPTFPEDIDVYNTELPGVIAGQGTLTSQLNTFIAQVGTLEANVIALEVATLGAADIAAANANFKGTWLGATSYAVPSSVYYNGEYFIALSPSSNQIPNPLAATAYWAPYSIAFQITNATAKTTPVDADVFGFLDSAASMILKKLTWANIKTALNLLYVGLTGNQTIAGIKTFSSNPLSSAAQDTAISALTRKDYVDGSLALKAPLASPTLTGAPLAPTATVGTNTTQLATTAFANAAAGGVNTPAASLATNGYSKSANGLIEQWGTTANIPAGGSVAVTFPTPFATQLFGVVATYRAFGSGTNNGIVAPQVTLEALGGCTISNFDSDTGAPVFWFAKGY